MNYKYLVIISVIVCLFACANPKKSKSDKNTVTDKNRLGQFDVDSFNKVNLKEINAQISYPKDWLIIKDEAALFCSVMQCSDTVEFCPNIVITKINNSENISPVQYGDIVLNKIKSKSEYIKLVSATDEVVNGLDFFIIDYKFITNSIKLGGTTAIFKKDKFIVDITCMAPNKAGEYVQYRKIFNKVIFSFNLI